MTNAYQRLLVPVNGTSCDERSIALVGDLLHRNQASVTLIYVVEVPQAMPLDSELPDQIDRGETILRNAEEAARTHISNKLENVSTDLLQARAAGAAIVDEAYERGVDAIVIATSNRNKLGKTSVGDTVSYIVKNAPCDVILLRLGANPGNA
ncbi:MAG: universal stress protein [Rhizobiales bacterium]|nr:universal stress protein [Hyphomicrobiales bacterium]